MQMGTKFSDYLAASKAADTPGDAELRRRFRIPDNAVLAYSGPVRPANQDCEQCRDDTGRCICAEPCGSLVCNRYPGDGKPLACS
jgi:hypothetical protein